MGAYCHEACHLVCILEGTPEVKDKRPKKGPIPYRKSGTNPDLRSWGGPGGAILSLNFKKRFAQKLCIFNFILDYLVTF